MPAWPRTILPQKVSLPRFPAPMISPGETGKAQLRAFPNMGRRWTETYPALSTTDPLTLGFLAVVQDYWRSATIFTIDHRMFQTPKGVATGTPLVNGGSQTGASLITDGWTNSITNILRAGDILKVAGMNVVFDQLADVNSNGSGQATLTLSPPIFAGQSPADNAALTVTGVTFRAFFADPPVIPDAGPDQIIEGIVFSFMEMP